MMVIRQTTELISQTNHPLSEMYKVRLYCLDFGLQCLHSLHIQPPLHNAQKKY